MSVLTAIAFIMLCQYAYIPMIVNMLSYVIKLPSIWLTILTSFLPTSAVHLKTGFYFGNLQKVPSRMVYGLEKTYLKQLQIFYNVKYESSYLLKSRRRYHIHRCLNHKRPLFSWTLMNQDIIKP